MTSEKTTENETNIANHETCLHSTDILKLPTKMCVKIYFSGSLSRCLTDVDVYRRHIERLEEYGVVVNKDIVGKGDTNTLTDIEIFTKNMDRLKIADVLVAEVTQPSMGVGYEIGLASALKKRVLCLYRPEVRQVLTPMIAGSENDDDFIVKYYREREAVSVFRDVFGHWFSKGSNSDSREGSLLGKTDPMY